MAASWPFRPRTWVPLHPHKSNVLLVCCCLSLNILILEKKCCFQTRYVPDLRPRLPLPRLAEAGVVVAPEPGSDPSAQVLSWIEVQNNISAVRHQSRKGKKQSILRSLDISPWSSPICTRRNGRLSIGAGGLRTTSKSFKVRQIPLSILGLFCFTWSTLTGSTASLSIFASLARDYRQGDQQQVNQKAQAL